MILPLNALFAILPACNQGLRGMWQPRAFFDVALHRNWIQCQQLFSTLWESAWNQGFSMVAGMMPTMMFPGRFLANSDTRFHFWYRFFPGEWNVVVPFLNVWENQCQCMVSNNYNSYALKCIWNKPGIRVSIICFFRVIIAIFNAFLTRSTFNSNADGQRVPANYSSQPRMVERKSDANSKKSDPTGYLLQLRLYVLTDYFFYLILSFIHFLSE
jgi:hypothetical protein